MSDYIPEGILVQILKLLHVKSLLRFRSVCKRWKEYIDSPEFLQQHLAVQKPRFLVESDDPGGFLIANPSALHLDHTPRAPIEDDGNVHLIGTLHGVVCVYHYKNCDDSVLLWNPSIRKFSSVPLPVNFPETFHTAWARSGGFWIDPCTKEFKIMISLFAKEGNEEPNIIIYSSIQHGWNRISMGEVGRIWHPKQFVPLMTGGVAHWGELSSDNDLGIESGTKLIMAFDFNQQSFEFIEMPNLNSFNDGSGSLGRVEPTLCVWRGALSVLCRGESFPHRCELYSMQQGSWGSVFAFQLLPSIDCVYWPLEGMEESGRILAHENYGMYNYKLVVYDTSGGGSGIPLSQQVKYFNEFAYDYVESFLFPLE